MSYEFSSDSNNQFVTTPAFWQMRRMDHVHDALHFDPFFVKDSAIIEGFDSGQVGIDSNDRPLQLDENEDFTRPLPIGVMRVAEDRVFDGFIADLRYKLIVPRRDLDFGSVEYLDEENQHNKTIPVLGAIFRDDFDGSLLFPIKRELRDYEEKMHRWGAILLTYVDSERAKRHLAVTLPVTQQEDASRVTEPKPGKD